MDTSFALVPSFPYQEPAVPDWAPLACMSMLTLASFLAAASEEEGEQQQEQQEAQEPASITTEAPSPQVKQPRPKIPGLEEILLDTLKQTSSGLRAKELVPIVRRSFPEVTKKDINSCLYKMLNARKVTKTTDAAPVWKA